ncbi:hypothetical protein JXA84_06885 [candidate division WOR-3 bacterium]|nr:hypothetical protein [candidate division WOR-3 bacterium]
MKRTLFLATVFFTYSLSLYCTPFLQGNYIDAPNAYLMPHSSVQITSVFTVYSQDFIRYGASYETFSQYVFGANLSVGLYDWVEVGGGYLGTDVWSAFAKVRVLRETERYPAFALGIQNISPYEKMSEFGRHSLDYYDHNQNFSFYGVFTKDLTYYFPSIPVILSFGLGSGRFLGERPRSEPLRGIFASIEYRPIKNFKFISDMDGKDWNFASMYRANDNIEFLIGWLEIEQTFGVNYVARNCPTEQQKIVMGVQLNFGPFFGSRALSVRRQRELEIMSNYQRELEEIRRQREEAERELERLRRILEESQ